MNLQLACVICGKEILHPTVNCHTCGDSECKRKYDLYACSIYKQVKKQETKEWMNRVLVNHPPSKIGTSGLHKARS